MHYIVVVECIAGQMCRAKQPAREHAGTARHGPGTARAKRAVPGTRHALGRAWAWSLGTRAGTARPV